MTFTVKGHCFYYLKKSENCKGNQIEGKICETLPLELTYRNYWIKVGLWYKSTCIRSLTIEGQAAFEYQKIFTNALKSAYLNLSEQFDQEKIAKKIILLEMPLIQVEGFLNLK